MTASEFVCRQAGLSPKGSIGSTREICVMCGGVIQPGEYRSTCRFSSSFMDYAELCGRGSTKLCGWCGHMTNKALMLRTQKVCITEKKVLLAAGVAGTKWLLLNPPEPPFLFLQGDTKLSHMIWRTPLTVSQDLWYVRVGARLLTVRLPLVHKAMECFKRIAERFSAETNPKWPLKHPFTTLDFKVRDVNAWTIRHDVMRHLHSEDLNLIMKLRPGEYWAVAILNTKVEPKTPKAESNATL